MALRKVLQHRAVRLRVDPRGAIVEGERTEELEESPIFPCVIFPPGTREPGRSGKRTERPILLFEGRDLAGAELVLRAEDRIRVTEAPGLDGPVARDEYQVDGDPQWLGKPGKRPKAVQVFLKRVEE